MSVGVCGVIFWARGGAPERVLLRLRVSETFGGGIMERRYWIWMLVLVGVIGGIVGCKGAEREHEGLKGSECLVRAEYPDKRYGSDEERWEAERELRIGEAFRERVNGFGFETAARLFSEDRGNQVYSPVSLYFSLAVAAAGAQGETGQELLGVLGYEDEGRLAEDCREAFAVFYQDQDGYKLQIASSVWVDKRFEVKGEFLDHVKEAYFGEVFRTDFSGEDAGADMASWVKEKTYGVLEPSVETKEGQVLSLLNAVYYYDEWLDQFDKDKTEKGIFTCGDGTEVECDFMNRTMGSHGFVRGENYTVSGISGKNGRMLVLLPDRGEDLWQFLESGERLEAVLNEEEGESGFGEVVWQVPKFSYGSSYGLRDVLERMGVWAAFSPEKADFSGISHEVCWIDSVIQEAHIGIDENGIEAASFTQMDWAGAALPSGRAEMILDRPFLYVVQEKGCPLFIGICENPADGE